MANMIIAGIESSIVLDNKQFLAAMKQTKDSARSAGAGLGHYGKMIGGLEKDSEKTGRSFAGLATTMAGVMVAATAVGAAFAKMGYGLARSGAQLEDAKIVFRAAGNDLNELRKATNNMLSDDFLVKKFNFATQMGINKSQFGELMMIADAAAKKMGISQEYAAESLVTGSARGSKLILDNVGILMETEKAHERYARSLNKTAKELTDAEQKQAIINEVLRQGRDMMKDVQGVGAQTSDVYDQMDAAVANATSTFGLFLSKTLATSGALTKGLIPALNAVSGFFADDVDGSMQRSNLMESLKETALTVVDPRRGVANILRMGGMGHLYQGPQGSEFEIADQFTNADRAMVQLGARMADLRMEAEALQRAASAGVDATGHVLSEDEIIGAKEQVKDLHEEIEEGTAKFKQWRSGFDAAFNRIDVTKLGPVDELGSVANYKALFDMRIDSESRVADARAKAQEEAKRKEKEIQRAREQAEKDIANLRRQLQLQLTPDDKRPGVQAMQAIGFYEPDKNVTARQRATLVDLNRDKVLAELAKDIVDANESMVEMNRAADNAAEGLDELSRNIFASYFNTYKAMSGKIGASYDDVDVEGKMVGLFEDAERASMQAMRDARERGERTLVARGEVDVELDEEALRKALEVMLNDTVDMLSRGKSLASSAPGSIFEAFGAMSGGSGDAAIWQGLMDPNGSVAQSLGAAGSSIMSGDLAGAGSAIGTAIGGPAGAAIGAAVAEVIGQITDVMSAGLKAVFSDSRLSGAASSIGLGVGLVSVPLTVLGTVAAAIDLSTQKAAFNRDGSAFEGRSEYEKFQAAMSYALDPLITTLGQLWVTASPLIGLFELMVQAVTPMAQLFVEFAGDPIKLAFNALQVFASSVGMVAQAVLGLAGLFYAAQEAIAGLLGMEDVSEDAGENKRKVDRAYNDLVEALDTMWNTSFEEAGERGEVIKTLIEEAKARRENEVYNGPAGFKVAAYDFGASDARASETGEGNEGRSSIGQYIEELNLEIVTDRTIRDLLRDTDGLRAGQQTGNRNSRISPVTGAREPRRGPRGGR